MQTNKDLRRYLYQPRIDPREKCKLLSLTAGVKNFFLLTAVKIRPKISINKEAQCSKSISEEELTLHEKLDLHTFTHEQI